jgi:hypothetical protein
MTPVLTWRQLRELAEKVQGNQHQDLGIRVDRNELVVEELDLNKEYVATIPMVPTLSKKPMKVLLDPPVLIGDRPTAETDITQTADAVFWSVAAVEKFLVPYYASFKRTGDAAQKLLDEFAKADVVAILHLPNSEPTTARDGAKKFFALVAPGPEKTTNAPYTLRRID